MMISHGCHCDTSAIQNRTASNFAVAVGRPLHLDMGNCCTREPEAIFKYLKRMQT